MAITFQTDQKSERPNPFPLLETGYHLTADEFHERYKLLLDEQHAELIEGIVYMASPISRLHSLPDSTMNGFCMVYAAHTPETESSGSGTVRLDPKNEYEPDGYLRKLIGCGTQIFDQHYLEGVPEFVFEISNTTVTMDLHEKYDVYQRNGVQEYLVWQVQEQRIELFILVGGKFEKAAPDVNGILRSKAFQGFWLDTRAMINGNNATALATLQLGIESAEHTEFVKRLQGGAK
jgi:Uma2 family endonuclease